MTELKKVPLVTSFSVEIIRTGWRWESVLADILHLPSLHGLALRCQFHQHFTRALFVQTSFWHLHVSRKRCRKALLNVKFVHLTLMKLTTGGQILSKKRSFFGSKQKNGEPGNATTEFGPDLPIGTLKKRLREATNRIAEDFDEATRQAVLVKADTHMYT